MDPYRLQGYHGVPSRQIVADLVAPHRVRAAADRIHDLELADVDGVVALPGAVEALAALPAGRAAVVTSCSRPLALARIGAAGLRVPDAVVTADDVRRGKPDPEPFLLGAERLGVAPQDCLVVEDAPSGLAAARAAGMASLAVTTTTDAADLDADLVVTNLADVELVAGPDGVRLVRKP